MAQNQFSVRLEIGKDSNESYTVGYESEIIASRIELDEEQTWIKVEENNPETRTVTFKVEENKSLYSREFLVKFYGLEGETEILLGTVVIKQKECDPFIAIVPVEIPANPKSNYSVTVETNVTLDKNVLPVFTKTEDENAPISWIRSTSLVKDEKDEYKWTLYLNVERNLKPEARECIVRVTGYNPKEKEDFEQTAAMAQLEATEYILLNPVSANVDERAHEAIQSLITTGYSTLVAKVLNNETWLVASISLNVLTISVSKLDTNVAKSRQGVVRVTSDKDNEVYADFTVTQGVGEQNFALLAKHSEVATDILALGRSIDNLTMLITNSVIPAPSNVGLSGDMKVIVSSRYNKGTLKNLLDQVVPVRVSIDIYESDLSISDNIVIQEEGKANGES